MAQTTRSELNRKGYLEGQGDLVSRLIRGITGFTIWMGYN